jgi:CheY-like chemotaxis protein
LRGKRDGIEAALEIRQRFGIASVFATAHNEAEMRSRGAAAQPRAWLTKPYSDQQLLRAVKAALVRLD